MQAKCSHHHFVSGANILNVVVYFCQTKCLPINGPLPDKITTGSPSGDQDQRCAVSSNWVIKGNAGLRPANIHRGHD